MSNAPWLADLTRGGIGLALFGLLFVAARRRFGNRKGQRGPADIGLD